MGNRVTAGEFAAKAFVGAIQPLQPYRSGGDAAEARPRPTADSTEVVDLMGARMSPNNQADMCRKIASLPTCLNRD